MLLAASRTFSRVPSPPLKGMLTDAAYVAAALSLQSPNQLALVLALALPPLLPPPSLRVTTQFSALLLTHISMVMGEVWLTNSKSVPPL